MRSTFALCFVVLGCSASPSSQPLPPTVDRLSVSGSTSVRVLVGSAFEPELRVEGEGVDVEVTHRSLSLSAGEGAGPVIVLLPALRQLTVDDGATATVSAMQGGRVELAASGGGKVVVERLDADSLLVSATGAGSVDVGGRARAVTAVATELSTIDLGALRAEVTRVEVSELSNVRATTGQVLRAVVNGASRLTVDRLPASRHLVVDPGSAVEVGAARTRPVSALERW